MASLTEKSVFERFGFVPGQISADSFARGYEWFDHTGAHISQGDLGGEEFMKLSQGLDDGEFFIAIPGPEVYFGTVEKTLESVIAHARFMVGCGLRYEIVEKVEDDTAEHGGVSFAVVSHEEALTVLKVFGAVQVR